MRHLLLLSAAFSLMGSALLANEPTGQGFFDDFSGGVDNRRWHISDGWTNGDWQDCHWSRKAVKHHDGMVTLQHIPAQSGDTAPPQCGEIQSKAFFQYGTFEARIRTPRASGLNASVFTYTGPVFDAPHDEIDIEILLRDPGRMTVNTFVGGKAQNGGNAPASPAFDEDFHTVAFRWLPDGITWYLDGREVHRTAPGSPLPTHPQKFYLSLWSSTTLIDWLGEPSKHDAPLSYDIDWVAYTPPDASCLFPASITCEAQ